ncbi:DUF6404 family protein [Paragemmobacter ruber]|uniref:Uncharacterized protein n=1 Tax=Paragemmobacter ruber TaxID=1985673 RepID=A0ABW9Y9H8_9RHOB|nr:DUF6404 family protein [Rhodobacter ruber]NBE09257.1 hypothetical protein [Rhodobacter ruber]
MPNPDFEARLARLRQSERGQTAPTKAPHPPARHYRDRLNRALAAASAAGIGRNACFPPAMRALARLGLPVRPLHFKSTASLFASGVCLGLAIFGGTLWLFTSGLLSSVPAGPIRGLVTLGWPGVAALSLGIGAAFAAIIRAQAARARLPRWQDL